MRREREGGRVWVVEGSLDLLMWSEALVGVPLGAFCLGALGIVIEQIGGGGEQA